MKKRFYCGSTAAATGSRERLIRFRRKGLITVELLNFDRLEKVQVNVRDIDLIKWYAAIHQMSSAFEESQKDLQIQIIGHHSAIRVSAHRGMVFQKLQHDIRNVIDLIQLHKR